MELDAHKAPHILFRFIRLRWLRSGRDTSFGASAEFVTELFDVGKELPVRQAVIGIVLDSQRAWPFPLDLTAAGIKADQRREPEVVLDDALAK